MILERLPTSFAALSKHDILGDKRVHFPNISNEVASGAGLLRVISNDATTYLFVS